MGRIGMSELIVLMIIALIVFGPKNLPTLGKSLGESIKNFKNAMGLDENDKIQ